MNVTAEGRYSINKTLIIFSTCIFEGNYES